MKQIAIILAAVAVVSGGAAHSGFATARAEEAAPNGISIPAGYRHWSLISVAREEGKLDDLRAILGNDIAAKASREGLAEFPDGAIIARLSWSFDPLEESAEAFGHPQTHIAGRPKNGVQFMVKDSLKFASTGGWGFAQFDDGKPSGQEAACFACHSVVKGRDFVFNRFAPEQPNGDR